MLFLQGAGLAHQYPSFCIEVPCPLSLHCMLSAAVFSHCLWIVFWQFVKGILLAIGGVSGLRMLLGLRSTIGSKMDWLPLPRCTVVSVLLSYFVFNLALPVPCLIVTAVFYPMGYRSILVTAFNKIHSEKSLLTIGARALSKHVNRGSDGYFGILKGNDPAKNAGTKVVVPTVPFLGAHQSSSHTIPQLLILSFSK